MNINTFICVVCTSFIAHIIVNTIMAFIIPETVAGIGTEGGVPCWTFYRVAHRTWDFKSYYQICHGNMDNDKSLCLQFSIYLVRLRFNTL